MNQRQRYLDARIRHMDRLNKFNNVPKDIAESSIERELERDFDRWSRKVKMHLPALAQRVFALRGKHYNGCGFHYTLEAKLGRVIYDLNHVKYGVQSSIEKMSERIATEVNVRILFSELSKIEKESSSKKITVR